MLQSLGRLRFPILTPTLIWDFVYIFDYLRICMCICICISMTVHICRQPLCIWYHITSYYIKLYLFSITHIYIHIYIYIFIYIWDMYKMAHLLCIITYHMLAYHSLLQPPSPSSRRKATRPKRRPLEKAPKTEISWMAMGFNGWFDDDLMGFNGI